MKIIITSIFCLVLCFSIPASTELITKTNNASLPEIKISINPVVCLHYHLRSMLLGDVAAEKAYSSALDSARNFENEVKTPLRWGFIEPFLTQCQTASMLGAWTDKIPERFRLRSGMVVTPRETLSPYTEALVEAEPAYMQSTWPVHREPLLEAKKKLDNVFNEQGAELLEFITDKLDIETDHRPLRIYLTPATPLEGGSTCSARGVGVVSFVNISGASEAKMIEVVLHEAIHALDLRSQGKPTVLNLIRKKLIQSGIQPNNSLFRDLPHAVVFVQAAETVLRYLHPEPHEFQQDPSFFNLSPEIVKTVPLKWKAYLDGSMSREEIIDAVAAVE